MQAWWAAGSVMLTQGSSACACAGGMQRGASAIAAAADTPIIALFISSSFPDPLMSTVEFDIDTTTQFCDGRMSGAVIYRYVIRVEEQESESGGGASDDLGHQVHP